MGICPLLWGTNAPNIHGFLTHIFSELFHCIFIYALKKPRVESRHVHLYTPLEWVILNYLALEFVYLRKWLSVWAATLSRKL